MKTRRYRYYVSNRLFAGGQDPAGWRLPARPLEHIVATAVVDHLTKLAKRHELLAKPDARRADEIGRAIRDLRSNREDLAHKALGLLTAGRMNSRMLRLRLDGAALADLANASPAERASEALDFDVPFSLRRRGVELKIVAASVAPQPDPTLIRTLRDAHEWTRALGSGRGVSEIAKSTGHSDSFMRTRAPLAFLSPRLQQAILDGTQPPDLTLRRMMRQPVPIDWDEQERLYGLSPA